MRASEFAAHVCTCEFMRSSGGGAVCGITRALCVWRVEITGKGGRELVVQMGYKDRQRVQGSLEDSHATARR
jgi:hypothetical protein